ncbi:glutamine synthetase family protein [Nitratireductor sp. StC3]|uniref:glutamine synthetase family protein n=1 Tax=Nitratireductor sp. StC3 TaxID=2126741 RepID=UPI000D0CA23A|nr:glutamine synthetase family protein [Nitratireductor sp. StC3]PSM19753.1 glutamine synthetase [Nitratireductor sp. StC3]
MSTSDAAGLGGGFTGRHGLLGDDALRRANEILGSLEARGLETVRLVFADQHGVLRGKTVVASALKSAFREGMAITSTLLLKDTSHRTVFSVWEKEAGHGVGALTGAGDVMLVPDPATFRVLPWSPHSGWILCDVYFKDGTAFPFGSRTILRNAVDRLAKAGMAMVCGLEVEFYVFKIDQPRLNHGDGGMPATPPETSLLSHGYQYLTEARYDALETVMDELRRACQALGLPVRSMEAEFGPSQCEFTFEPAGPMDHADAMMLFRSTVKQVCARQGLHATFMCRPKVDNGMASGWHLHQSVVDTGSGKNLFVPNPDGSLSTAANGWIAGLLDHAVESCLLTTPTVNGYKRYQAYQLAPDRIQWGRDNKGAMIRALMAPGDRASRVENRIAEPAANPYFYFASQILGGLDGIERKLVAPPAVEKPYDNTATALPKSLIAAIEAFEKAGFYRDAIGTDFVDYLAHIKRAEWDRYLMTVSEWEQREYFSLF